MAEFLIVVAYIVITTFLGWYLTSRAKARNDINSFFVGKKELSWILVMFVMFGECIAGASSIGAAQTSYKMGLSAVWTNWGQCLGIIVFVLTVSKLYRTAGHYGKYSVPEAYQFRFGSQRCRVVVMAIVVIVYTILYALQPKAAGAILSPMLGVNIKVCAWVMAAIFVLQALSGLKGIAWMNVVHSSVLFLGCLIVMLLSWNKAGGISAVYENLNASYLSVTQPSLLEVVGNALAACSHSFCPPLWLQTSTVQRASMTLTRALSQAQSLYSSLHSSPHSSAYTAKLCTPRLKTPPRFSILLQIPSAPQSAQWQVCASSQLFSPPLPHSC